MSQHDPSDANGEQARDPFRPPAIACEVQCLHCGKAYESWQIEWRELDDGPTEKLPIGGTWCCPTPGCDGIGFGFDIFPVDPEWADEHGEKMCVHFEDDDEDEEDANPFGSDEEDEEDAFFPVDAFDENAFWIDPKLTRSRKLGNTPQAPFNQMPPTKLFGSAAGEEFDDDDIPF